MPDDHKFLIRPARLDDAPVLFDIHVDAVENQCAGSYTVRQINGWFEGRSAEDDVGRMSRGNILVAAGGV